MRCSPSQAVFHAVNTSARYKITGEFKIHKKYGEQFVVTSYEEMVPKGEEGIRAFLASESIRGIGRKTAGLIVDAFGEDSLRVIGEEPEKLLQIKGIGKKTLASIIEFRTTETGNLPRSTRNFQTLT